MSFTLALHWQYCCLFVRRMVCVCVCSTSCSIMDCMLIIVSKYLHHWSARKSWSVLPASLHSWFAHCYSWQDVKCLPKIIRNEYNSLWLLETLTLDIVVHTGSIFVLWYKYLHCDTWTIMGCLGVWKVEN